MIDLIHHLAVLLARIRQGQWIHEETPYPKLAKRHEFKIAEDITNAIEEHFHVHFQEQELYYITMHLMGKRLAMNETAIDPMINACIERILDRIKEEKKIDLTGDEELKTALSLHILPLLSRMKFGIQMEDPISRDIKREMNRSWRIALLAKHELEKINGDSMSDDEVSFLVP